MEQRSLRDLTVSAIGLGCMGMPEFYGTTDDSESTAVIHRAPAQRTVDRRRAVCQRAGYVRRLRRLAECLVPTHDLSTAPGRFEVPDTLSATASGRAGKVSTGLSERLRPPPAGARGHPITPPPRDVEDEILPTVRDLGIGFVAYSPLGRGLLTGAYRSAADLPEGDTRPHRFPRFGEEHFDRNLGLVDAVTELAATKGCAPGQVAIAWVLAQGDDVVPIPGTKRLRYLEENVAAADVVLDADDLAWLDANVGPPSGERYADMGTVNR